MALLELNADRTGFAAVLALVGVALVGVSALVAIIWFLTPHNRH